MQITEFEHSKKFDRSLKKIQERELEELAEVYDEFASGEVPPGRELKKVKGLKDGAPPRWEVRLNRKFRFIFDEIGNKRGRPVAIEPHDFRKVSRSR